MTKDGRRPERLRVVLVTGIYPPDIGGPATHATDLAAELRRRGHRVVIVTLWDGPHERREPGVIRFPRRWPWPRRHAAVASWLVRHRRRYDVVYAIGLHPSAVAGALMAARPVVVKVAGDPAWERVRRLGLTDVGFEDFQQTRPSDPRVVAMSRLRNWWIRRATAVVAPSRYLADVVAAWVAGAVHVEVVPNGVRVPTHELPRREGDGDGLLRAMFVGRLVPHKHVDVLIEAIVGAPRVALEIVGEGPSRRQLESRARGLGVTDRVVFSGSLSHGETLQRLTGADVLVSASGYEGLPHVAIEALACGTPVVAPRVGGMGEVVEDGVNGLIVPAPTPEAFAADLMKLRDDPTLRSRLSEQAFRDADRWSFDRCADGIEGVLRRARRPKPRTIFLGKGAVPKGEQSRGDFKTKLTILARHLDPTFITVGPVGHPPTGGPRIVAFPDLKPHAAGAAFFYAAAPGLAVILAAGRRRTSIVCQSPYEGLGAVLLARMLPPSVRPLVIIEVHGDWRAATRLYGSRARRWLTPVADQAAVWAVRRADRVRVISEFTEGLVRRAGYRGDVDRFITFSDFDLFLTGDPAPMPEAPHVAFVGLLGRTKGVDVLLEAWALTVRRLPDARLLLVGDGPLRQVLARRAATLSVNGSIEFLGGVSRSEVKTLLDRCGLLVIPSRSEGQPRVVLEAFSRARPVVGTRVGGIPELVEEERTGKLVPPENPQALADAMVDLLQDPERLRTMGEEGRRRVQERNPRVEFEMGIERLAAWLASGTG